MDIIVGPSGIILIHMKERERGDNFIYRLLMENASIQPLHLGIPPQVGLVSLGCGADMGGSFIIVLWCFISCKYMYSRSYFSLVQQVLLLLLLLLLFVYKTRKDKIKILQLYN